MSCIWQTASRIAMIARASVTSGGPACTALATNDAANTSPRSAHVTSAGNEVRYSRVSFSVVLCFGFGVSSRGVDGG